MASKLRPSFVAFCFSPLTSRTLSQGMWTETVGVDCASWLMTAQSSSFVEDVTRLAGAGKAREARAAGAHRP